MAKASLTLSNGTVVQIEGTTEEVRDLLQFYEEGTGHKPPRSRKPASHGKASKPGRSPAPRRQPAGEAGDSAPNLPEIVTLAKNCDEAEKIERQILDRAVTIDCTLLPLYIVHEHLENAFGLSSGEVSKITTDLGVPVSQPNASKTFSGTAAKYVIGDKVRKKGQMVRYKLSRRGLHYIQAAIRGNSDGNAG